MTQTTSRGSALPQAPQRVLIAGYYGFGNVGDEAILQAMCGLLRREWPTTQITVVSGTPEETKRTFAVDSVLWTDIPEITAAIRRSDLVVIGGGGLFHDYWGIDPDAVGTEHHSGLVFYSTIAGIAAFLGKKIALWSLGVGPLLTADARKMTADVFNSADVVSVRDAASGALLRDIGVTAEAALIADPAFAFDVPQPARPRDRKLRVVVALRNWTIGIPATRWEREVAGAIDTFIIEHDAEAIFVPFQTIAGNLEDDPSVAQRVIAQMKNADRTIMSPAADARAAATEIASADVVLGMRYHALIFAATAGVPFVAIEYDPKVGSWAAEAEATDLTVDMLSIRAEDIARKLSAALDRRDEIGVTLRKLARDKRASAESFVKLLRPVASQAHESNLLTRVSDALAKHVVDRPAAGAAALRDQVEALEKALQQERKRSEEKEGELRNNAARVAALESDLLHLRTQAEKAERVAGRLTLPATSLRSRPYDVVCFSIIDWEFRWQRPQQIMSELADRGHRVFYVSISRFAPLDNEPFRAVELRKNVWEIQLSVPEMFSVYEGTISPDAQLQLELSLEGLRNEFGIQRAVSIVQLATWGPVALRARERFGWPVAYDCMDEWDTFPGIRSAVLTNERQLVAEADLLIVTSEKLAKKWGKEASNLVLARNATRFAQFERAQPKAELTSLKHPVIGYFGAIADWFDLELMTKVAKQRPSYSFVLVGEIFGLDTSELGALPNVRLEGAQPYAEIPSYLASFDVCIIPFKVNAVTAATDPVKFYEYITQGKPVVSTPMPELEIYSDLLYLARDSDDFLRKLDTAVAEDDAKLRQKRVALAHENDWGHRAEAIEEGVEKAFVAQRRRTLHGRIASLTGDESGQITPDLALGLIEEAVTSQQESRALAGKTLSLARELARRSDETRESERRSFETVQQRDRVVRELQRDLFEKVGERDRLIGALQAQLQERVGERDRTIEGLQRALHDAVAERDARIAALQSDLVRLQTDLRTEADDAIAGRDATISSLNGELGNSVAERDALRERLDATVADYQALEEERNALQAMIADLDARLHRTTNDYQHLERTAMSLRQELHAVHFSKFWKAASVYWRALEKVKKITGTQTQPAAEPISVTASAVEESVPVAVPAATTRPVAVDATVSDAPITVSNRHDVICFPIIDWNFRFQRPQQLMTQFAERGHRVFYIAQKFRQNGPLYKLARIAHNVYEVSLRGPSKNVYTDRLTEREISSLFDALDALRREQSLGATVSVVQLPFWTSVAEKARANFAWPLVYDCMDHHAGFTTNTDAMLNEETRLLTGADLVVVSSLFLEHEAKKHNDHVVLVRNGCDYDHFASIVELRNERPVVGYYGAIADWFDSDLVASLAERRPDWDFILVGSTFTADVSRLKKLKNVLMPGEKPYGEIPHWLQKFDVAIIPFKRLPLTEATNPVKAYEMLAGGKPVVSVPIPEVVPMAPQVRLASTVEEFEREIKAAMAGNGPEEIAARRRFAAEHTWATRYETLEPAVIQTFPKASIVVVTYNNVDLNRLCLESFYGNHEWPNFELFVVDNASSDSTPDYLREAEKTYPHLTVILNEDNRGFAAANNQALRVATGDFLVLLNNDTVSPRGWLAALIRHLTADRSIGLIGPSTNAIGNEGIVDVGYTEIADMPAWAADFMRRNDGKVFDIAMLAMFCVAMRRDVFEIIGLLDENFGVGMYEDDDYAHRMRLASYRVVCARDSFVHHWMRAAFGKIPTDEYQRLFDRNRQYYESKWATKWTPHTRG